MDRSSNPLTEDYSWSFTIRVWLGNISGRVRDENGVELADVTVTIQALDVTVHTSSNGSYIFEDIPTESEWCRREMAPSFGTAMK